jgi:hypothetical protein
MEHPSLGRQIQMTRHARCRNCGQHVETASIGKLTGTYRFAYHVVRLEFDDGDRHVRILQKIAASVGAGNFPLEFRQCPPRRPDGSNQRHPHRAGGVDLIHPAQCLFSVDRHLEPFAGLQTSRNRRRVDRLRLRDDRPKIRVAPPRVAARLRLWLRGRKTWPSSCPSPLAHAHGLPSVSPNPRPANPLATQYHAIRSTETRLKRFIVLRSSSQSCGTSVTFPKNRNPPRGPRPERQRLFAEENRDFRNESISLRGCWPGLTLSGWFWIWQWTDLNPSEPASCHNHSLVLFLVLFDEGVGGRIVDVEALKRLAIRLVALAEQHTDLPVQRDLRKLANELTDLIEGCEATAVGSRRSSRIGARRRSMCSVPTSS